MIAVILLIAALFYAAVIDIKRHEIDPIVYWMLTVSALVNIMVYGGPLADKLMAFFVIGSIMLFIATIRADLGGGDVKLTAFCALASGSSISINAILTAWFFAALFMLLSGTAKAKKEIPMAPFILLGYSIIYMYQINLGGIL